MFFAVRVLIELNWSDTLTERLMGNGRVTSELDGTQHDGGGLALGGWPEAPGLAHVAPLGAAGVVVVGPAYSDLALQVDRGVAAQERKSLETELRHLPVAAGIRVIGAVPPTAVNNKSHGQ